MGFAKSLSGQPASTQNHPAPRNALRASLKKQAGLAMLEAVAGITLAGSAAAVVLNHQHQAEQMALYTHAQLTAAALSSAVNLQQAQWAVARPVNSPLHFNAQGIALGVDANPAASEQDCQALWRHFMVSQPTQFNKPTQLTQPTPPIQNKGSEQAMMNAAKVNVGSHWQIKPEPVVGSTRCLFNYQHKNHPSIAVYYNTQTGTTAFK